MTIGANWAGLHTYDAVRLIRPDGIEAAQQAVRDADRIRAIGTRHSFHDLADGPGDLIDLTGLPADLADEGDGVVSVGAGTRYGDAARELHARGLALHNLGSLPHISIAGAVATGTHGSGVTNRSLAGAVAGLDVITADGSLRRIRRGDHGSDGAVVSLGALGVVARVLLDVQPAFDVRQDVYVDLPWEALLADPVAVFDSAYSVSVFLDWTGERAQGVWRKERLAPGTDAEPPADLHGARLAPPDASPAGEAVLDNKSPIGVPGPWSEHLPHFRLDATPSVGEEIQSEYYVPLDAAADALAAVRRLSEQLRSALHISELRTVAADDLWLSPAYRRDSLCIHFTWRKQPDEVRALLPVIERALAPFEPRPHWGKWFAADAATIAARYERMDDFRALVGAWDASAKFGGPYLERVLGLGGGARG